MPCSSVRVVPEAATAAEIWSATAAIRWSSRRTLRHQFHRQGAKGPAQRCPRPHTPQGGGSGLGGELAGQARGDELGEQGVRAGRGVGGDTDRERIPLCQTLVRHEGEMSLLSYE
jgi:hypothetical protein